MALALDGGRDVDPIDAIDPGDAAHRRREPEMDSPLRTRLLHRKFLE